MVELQGSRSVVRNDNSRPTLRQWPPTQGRPYRHLSSHQPMEENARELAERDGITDGLVCVYGAMETCRTFRVRFEERGPNLGPDRRVCLVIYFYWMDREFGLMHVKLQTWFPFTVQVYVNGHEWLARKLTHAGSPSRKSTTPSSSWLMSIGPAAARGSSGGAIGPSFSIAWRAASIRC